MPFAVECSATAGKRGNEFFHHCFEWLSTDVLARRSSDACVFCFALFEESVNKNIFFSLPYFQSIFCVTQKSIFFLFL